MLPSAKKESKSPPLGLLIQDLTVDVKADDSTPAIDTPPPESTLKLEDDGVPTPPEAKPVPKGPQLIGHLPRAETEALSTFVQTEANHYQYGTLGRSREALESMTCDCQYEHGVDEPYLACGHDSDCINRLTQVECLSDDCRCRAYCQNQRFQRREYADIEIVQTEKKGFGLRASKDLIRDTFIYEYVGDVISQPSFLKRMREYAQDGIRHFYFMMLQKDEFIDATKRGGIGRFANHSCNPNCYVAKWTIGAHVRMGIFANRNIKKDEELTFNYNVDRYGHEAQPCYCGEPKCVGFIGGKTQTDIGGMDDLYIDALGITDEVERLGLKGSKKRRGKKLDEDFVPILKPIVEKDIPKVVQAMRQTQSRKVLLKLLTRIKITEDQSALRQLMRLRGFSLMTNVLEDHANDNEIIALALECMISWPLLQRNKVDDSKISIPVIACAESENEVIKGFAQKLLDYWNTLQTAYRIPKRLKTDGEQDDPQPELSIVYTPAQEDDYPPPPKRSRYEETHLTAEDFGIAPRSYRPPVRKPEQAPVVVPDITEVRAKAAEQQRQGIAAILAEAAAAKEAADREAAARLLEEQEKEKEKERATRKKRPSKKGQNSEEREANKEKRLMKLVGAIVVKCMSKHQKQMEHDLFKKHAKELTQIICEKEKKSTSYKEGKLDALSEEKASKIKKFAKEYIAKILHKLDKTRHRQHSSHHRPRPPDSTSTTGADVVMNAPTTENDGDDGAGDMTVEGIMDMDPDSGGDGEGEDDDEYEMTNGDAEGEVNGKSDVSPAGSSLPPIPSTSASASPSVSSDPRLRPRREEHCSDPTPPPSLSPP